MCHCFQSVEDMTEKERTEVLEEHSEDELRAEYSSNELERLGIAA
jgi:hypothetical protein